MALVTDLLHSPVMYEREEGNDLPNQTNMRTLSPDPDRPPQYNARNCGYDCGYGCKKEKGGGAESDEETAVGDDENVPSDSETQNEDSQESEDLSTSLLSSRTAASDGTGLQLSSSQEESEDTSLSTVVEPNSSGNHTPVPTNGSARSLSPIPWIIMPVASPLPIEYYFLQTPLRLSPQYEDCRGDPASHLVVPDRSRLSYMMEQLAREYAPAYRNVSPPSFRSVLGHG